MILKLHGHIGDNASALVDGQLSAAAEERAWSHVLSCPGCRALVEHEGWIKQRLAGLSTSSTPAPHDRLSTLLHDPEGAALAWAEVATLERRSRRRTTAGLVGAGSLGLAALALVTLTGPPASRTDVPATRSPATMRPDVIGASIGGSVPGELTPVLAPGAPPRAAR